MKFRRECIDINAHFSVPGAGPGRVNDGSPHREFDPSGLRFIERDELTGLLKGDEQCKYLVDSDSDMSGTPPLVEGPLILRSFRRMPKHSCSVFVYFS